MTARPHNDATDSVATPIPLARGATTPRTCGHCGRPIREGEGYYLVPTPTLHLPVHVECLAKGGSS